MSCNCSCIPCQCIKRVTVNKTVTKFTPLITAISSFAIPECGETVNVDIKKVDALLIGGNLWSPTYGYFEITAYNATAGTVNIRNNCVDGNAEPGTVVEENSQFLLSPPLAAIDDTDVTSIAAEGETELTGDVTLSPGSGITLTQVGQDIEISADGPANLTLEVGEDCEAPGADNMLSELSYTGGVLTVKGKPEHYLYGIDAYQTDMNTSTFVVTPQYDLTLSPGVEAFGPVINGTIVPRLPCRYMFFTSTVDLMYLITNPNGQGFEFTVEIQKRINGAGAWIPISRQFSWLTNNLGSNAKLPQNMHRTFVDSFDSADGNYQLEYRARFYLGPGNTDTVEIEDVIMTASILATTNEVNY